MKSLEGKKTYTFNIEDSLKFNLKEAESINKTDDFEIAEYSIEKYEAAKERYKIFIKTISLQNGDQIMQEDLKQYNVIDKKILYVDLQKKYPNNKLLSEINRVNYLIDNYDENRKKDYDYDLKSQIEILEIAFKNRYINEVFLQNEDVEEIV